MRRLLVGLVLVVLGCGSGTEPGLGEEFSLDVGERATINELSLFVWFLGVEGDSRCPTRAQCVWAGDALVFIQTAPLDGDAKTDTLHTNTAVGPDSLDWSSAVLRLVRLDPYPEIPGSIAPNDYVVRLVAVSR